MAEALNTVVFDLGAVLIDWNPRYLYRKIFSEEDEIEYFLSEVCTPEWNRTLDAGRPFAQAIAECVERFPEHREAIDAYGSRWIEMINGPIGESVDLLHELSARHTPLYALTNWSAETFPLVRHDPDYDFLNKFRHIVVSGEVMMIKPDPSIFKYLLDIVDKPAETCLFIDDSIDNCNSAEEMGFEVHHFTSPERLAADLRTRELIE